MLLPTVLLALTGFATAAFNMDVHEKYLTLPREEFIEYFNSQNHSFKIKHYEHLEDKMLYGAMMNSNMSLVTKVKHERLQGHYVPDFFDSRTAWSHCPSVTKVYDQGQCGSCWTFGTATVLSDRTCIHTGVAAELSEQDFVCVKADVCAGSKPLDAFNYWVNNGFVTLNCLPYNAQSLRDRTVSCNKKCTNSYVDYQTDKHYGDMFYGLVSEDYNIRTEIVVNGPIQASFKVFEDFHSYTSGVYVHTYGDLKAMHSVRVLGFGNEGGVDYWLVANSWGSDWGESGYFKVKRFQGSLAFEDEMLTGLPYN